MTKNKPPTISDAVGQEEEAPIHAGLRLGTDAALAAAIVLVEIASAERPVDKFARSMVHAGIRQLFNISDESANAVINEAKNHLRNMRGSSSEAYLLSKALDPLSKRALAQIMDNIIKARGDTQGVEVYLRQRFRAIMGLPDVPLHSDTPELK